MSENNKQTPQNEEVDLGQIFVMIGKGLQSLFNFILFVLTAIFSVFIKAIAALVNNWKILIIAVVLAFGIGKLLEVKSPKLYSSKMLVKPYFESKFQLITNIDYYNALLDANNYKELSKIFSIDSISAKELVSFNIKPGPETENERIQEFDKFKKSIDSVTASKITIEAFVENRSIYNGVLFEIIAKSYKSDIFKDLESGLNSTFKNNYSQKIRERRDSIIKIQKTNLKQSLTEIKNLQKVYISIIEEDSKNPKQKSLTIGEGLSLSTNENKTREYDLLNREIEIRAELLELEKATVVEDDFFDVISSFQEVGTPVYSWKNRYSIVFPIVAVCVLIILFLMTRFLKYVKNYES